MARKLTKEEERILKVLEKLNKVWVKSVELFADNGTLVLIDSKTHEVLDDMIALNILCDGGDPSHEIIDGSVFLK